MSLDGDRQVGAGRAGRLGAAWALVLLVLAACSSPTQAEDVAVGADVAGVETDDGAPDSVIDVAVEVDDADAGPDLEEVDTTADVSRTQLVLGEVSLSPHALAPLAIDFRLEANLPCAVTVVLTSATEEVVFTSDLAASHDRTFVGVHADTTYEVLIVATDPSGAEVEPADLPAYVTAPLPDFIPPLSVLTLDPQRREPGFVLIPVGSAIGEAGSVIIALDRDAQVVWYYRHPDESIIDVNPVGLDARRLVVATHSERTYSFELDLAGRVTREWHTNNHTAPSPDSVGVDTEAFHHEFLPTAWGTVLALSVSFEPFVGYPLSPLSPLTNPEPVIVASDVIIEFDAATGAIHHELNLWDALQRTRATYESFGGYWDEVPYVLERFPAGTFDWAHANGVVVDGEGNYVVSLKNQEAVVSLSPAGEVRWILGDPARWTAPYGDKVLKPFYNPLGSPFEWPYAMHAPMLTSEGHLLLFDNGDGRAIPPTWKLPASQRYSRVVEYRIHEPSRTVEQVWSFGRERPDSHSPIVGDADALPITGNVLAVFGATSTPVEGALRGRILELTHTEPSEVVFELKVGDDNPQSPAWGVVYRAAHVVSLGD